MKTVALYSIKGGVGKTAAAVNLAYLAARNGSPSLLCDLDPQASASYYFRIRPPRKFTSKKLLKGGRNLSRNIRGTDFDGLDLVAADLSFRKLDLQLDAQKRPRRKLRSLFAELEQEYEYLFLDCPPNITLLSENVFRAADILLVPVIPTTLSVLTYQKLTRFLKAQHLNRSAVRAFFSMVELRKKLHRETMAEWGTDNRFLQARIPYLSQVERMGLYREPVVHRHAGSRAGRAYQALWNELSGQLAQR